MVVGSNMVAPYIPSPKVHIPSTEVEYGTDSKGVIPTSQRHRDVYVSDEGSHVNQWRHMLYLG